MYPVERRDADTDTSGQGGVEAEWVQLYWKDTAFPKVLLFPKKMDNTVVGQKGNCGGADGRRIVEFYRSNGAVVVK